MKQKSLAPKAPRWARETVWVVLLAGLVAWGMLRQRTMAWDDPYILLGFARNLADGHGWTLNAGAVTDNAITSPLMVFILAGARVVGVPMLVASAVLFHVSLVTASMLTRRALRSAEWGPGADLAAVLVATSPAFILMWGMESALYLMLLAACLCLSRTTRRWWILGMVVGLLGLVRPDGLLVGLVASTIVVASRDGRRPGRRDAAQALACALAPLVIWAAVQWMRIGEPFPSTLPAKTAQGRSSWWAVFGSWSEITSKWPWGLRGQLAPPDRRGDIAVSVGLVFVVMGASALLLGRRGWRLVAAVALPALVVAVIYGAVLRASAAPWYWSLTVYALCLLVAFGFETVLGLWSQSGIHRPWRGILATVAIAASAIVGLAGVRDWSTTPREEYTEIGGWLRANTPQNATVAAVEIGRLSWTSRRRIIDPLGLLDRELTRYVKQGDLTTWLELTQPDYWVLSRSLIDSPLRTSPCTTRHFVEVFGTKTFTVHRRISAIPFSTCAIG